MEGRGGEMIVIGSECGGGGRGGRILPQQAQSVRSPPPSASVRPSVRRRPRSSNLSEGGRAEFGRRRWERWVQSSTVIAPQISTPHLVFICILHTYTRWLRRSSDILPSGLSSLFLYVQYQRKCIDLALGASIKYVRIGGGGGNG